MKTTYLVCRVDTIKGIEKGRKYKVLYSDYGNNVFYIRSYDDGLLRLVRMDDNRFIAFVVYHNKQVKKENRLKAFFKKLFSK